MRVVAFTGMPGAGKSEAVAEAQRRAIPVVSMGDEVRAAVRARGLELIDANVGKLAAEMRRERGADWWARCTLERVAREHANARVLVVDGVRTRAEIDFFHEKLGDAFVLVAIEAPIEVRFERLKLRGRLDDGKTLDAVRERDARELGWGLQAAIDAAGRRLRNHGPIDRFRADVRTLFDELTRGA